MSKVLKSTLIEFVEACKQDINMHIKYLQSRESRRKSRELKELSNKAWSKMYELSNELAAQSGVSEELFRALACNKLSVRSFAEICSVLEVLGVEITDEEWYFEGEMIYNERLDRYLVQCGNEEITLNYGDKVAVKIDGYWLETKISYDDCRNSFSLQGCGRIKLDGKLARVML